MWLNIGSYDLSISYKRVKKITSILQRMSALVQCYSFVIERSQARVSPEALRCTLAKDAFA